MLSIKGNNYNNESQQTRIMVRQYMTGVQLPIVDPLRKRHQPLNKGHVILSQIDFLIDVDRQGEDNLSIKDKALQFI